MKRFEQKLKAQIFFVDDEPEICRVAKNTLEQTGATVKCFANGSECLAQLPSQRCDLLIIDMHMPGMSGIELLVEAKKILPEIPVLIVTGYADTAAARTAMKAGAKHVVEKPVYKKSFLLKVRSLLDKNTGAKQPEEKFSCVSDEESLGKKDVRFRATASCSVL